MGAARALLGWTQQELADKALVSRNTVSRIESAKGDVLTGTLDTMLRILAKAGIQFVSEEGYEGVRLRKRKGE